MSKRTCRKATTDDLPAVVALQNANLATNLSLDEQKDGFLSGAFSEDQFADLNKDVGILICVEDDAVVGFICLSSIEFNKPFPLPASMIDAFANLIFQMRALSSYESVIAGPVCVAKEKRGTGLFEFMYSQVPSVLPPAITLITTLVSTSNPRSLRAHEKVGMVTVGDFHFGSRDFVIMARLARVL